MSTRHPLCAVIAALLAAVVVTGCGGDGGTDDAQPAAPASSGGTVADPGEGEGGDASGDDAAAETGSEEAAAEVVRDFIRAVSTNDAATGCGLLNEDGEASFVGTADGLDGDDATCEEIVGFIGELNQDEEPHFQMGDEQIPIDRLDAWPFDAEISADGSSATVSSGRSSEAVELVLEDDGWKISKLDD